MNITLYSFAKRANSTARPSASAGMDFECKLKDTCSIMAPQIEFNLSFTLLPQTFNYAYIAEFQRYYFIENWTYVGRLWVASLVVDVLATFRNEILASEQYVLRSAQTSDGDITDTLYPLKNSQSVARYSIQTQYAATLSEGTYVVGIINGDVNAMGCTSYYFMSQSQFSALKSYLMSPVSNTTLSQFLTDIQGTITDISEGALKALFNPLQYIASCVWIPYNFNTTADVQGLPFGWWTLPSTITARRIPATDFKSYREVTISLLDHPQIARGQYLNAPPFTDYILYHPPWGSIPLDGALIKNLLRGTNNMRQITIKQTIDLVTGAAIGEVTGKMLVSGQQVEINLCPVMQAQLGLPIQLSQVTLNIANDWKTTAVAVGADTIAETLGNGLIDKQNLGTVGNALLGGIVDPINDISKGIAGISSNIATAAKASMTQMMSTGINGNMASLQTPAYLAQVCYTVVDDDNTHRGRPVCRKIRLSTLAGFTMIADPDIVLAAPDAEINAIKSYLIGGFFIE